MWAEVFVFHFLDEENIMKDPVPHKMCQHGALQTKCEKRAKPMSEREHEALCPTEDDFKYRLTRVSVEQVDLCLVEESCCCNVKVRLVLAPVYAVVSKYVSRHLYGHKTLIFRQMHTNFT